MKPGFQGVAAPWIQGFVAFAADRSASVLIVTFDLPDLTKLVAGRPGVAVVHVSKLRQPSGN